MSRTIAHWLRHVCLCLALACCAQASAQVLEIGADGGTREVGPGWNASADSLSAAESAARYTAIVRAAAEKYELSPLLLDAIARAESGYDATAVSPSGAIGIMQLMPATAHELGVDPWDPEQNIFGGAAFLRQQIDRFNGNLELALAAYNAGSARVIRFGGVPPYAQTRRYIEQNLERLAAASPLALPNTPFPSTHGELVP